MFDIGFWELTLIGIMGLVVLGPERLPVAIRTIKGWVTGVRKFSDSVKSELSEELRIHELHANLKKAEQTDMANLSPEVAESIKSLKEAAAMVNEPFKKIDKSSMDSFISTSLASQSTIGNAASSEPEDTIQTSDIQSVESSEKPQKSTQNVEHEVKQDK
ncbi:Sec-independent protein translocase protein TatB [Candidatus Colwellia aromaticivorans]|uniref:Sec-independent protein translocase protein TatB n=1 Tax=Candidatus Colwellia aromaticivorans TaxID=2267621 RepID=UPI000DF35A82|nr:Sec-independent protein translocase protein TatB [Candidatus Colwellia aromaticivorans]